MQRPAYSGPRDWDAETYDAVSDPQFEWGVEVVERVEPRGVEVVLDAGCGSGRVSAALLERRLPGARLIAVDASASMLAKARERLGERASYVVSELTELSVEQPVDLVFSTATFHWIADHELLFRRIRAALRPGGRLVAQCGGEGNVARHAASIEAVAAEPEFAAHFEGMENAWNFAAPAETEERLRAAGFAAASCWLEPKPVTPPRPRDFLVAVTLGQHLSRLPADLRDRFADAVLAREAEPLTLDYVRLNIDAVAGCAPPGCGNS
jgi:trans-aconitate 2-methyltransferase